MNNLSAVAEPWVQPMVGASTTILPTPKGVEHIGAKIIHLNSPRLGIECYPKRSLFISGNKFCYLKVRQLRRRRIPIVILNPRLYRGLFMV